MTSGSSGVDLIGCGHIDRLLTGLDAYDVMGTIAMSRPMCLLEQGKYVDDMLAEIQTEGEYRAVVSLAVPGKVLV